MQLAQLDSIAHKDIDSQTRVDLFIDKLHIIHVTKSTNNKCYKLNISAAFSSSPFTGCFGSALVVVVLTKSFRNQATALTIDCVARSIELI